MQVDVILGPALICSRIRILLCSPLHAAVNNAVPPHPLCSLKVRVQPLTCSSPQCAVEKCDCCCPSHAALCAAIKCGCCPSHAALCAAIKCGCCSSHAALCAAIKCGCCPSHAALCATIKCCCCHSHASVNNAMFPLSV